jgi:nitrite reductase/ring-hydroxylating ferredoxin subunit
MAGAAVLSGAGYLGGHLAYARGVGVDTTAFQELPEQWTSVAVDSIPEGGMVATTVNGVSVLLARRDGQWHGSRFRLTDGCVLAGPATRPQPVLEVRDLDGEIQIRLPDEAGALRTNPVGN